MLGDFLAGVRVLDVSQFLPGPFATQMLADMGADVLKVEPPAGDPQRRINPLTGQPGRQDKRGPFYDAVNAGKTVVKIDLKSDAGKQAFEDLLRAADVLLESYRPGVLDRLGFGRDHLEALNSGLIHCALSGYGQTGPNRSRSGHDINYVASTGAMSASGIAQRPVIGWPPAADYASALQAALTVSGALLARTRTGKGAYLDVSLSESMLAWQALGMTGASSGGGKAPERAANLLNGGAASYQVYETGDGRFVTLGAIEAHFWANFCQAVGRDDWLSRQHETLPQNALIGEVAALFATKPLAHWEQLLAEVDCCYYAVLDYAEAAADPHVVARGLMTGGEHDGETWTGVLFPAYVDGNSPQARTAVNEVDVETALSRWRD
ncbi:MAG: CoA transferase [Proteobacteria bacterium]|nr:CoA transferase [Pseudomonadota bacterium]MDA1022698.1 CoA transferase [Pseudomonadota bacterium]